MITNLSYLKSMSNGNVIFIKEMVDIFREQIEEYITEMPKLLAKADYDNLSKMAHKAKSSVAIMGMSKETKLLNKLEIKAKDKIEVETYENIINTFIENSTEAIKELTEQMKNS